MCTSARKNSLQKLREFFLVVLFCSAPLRSPLSASRALASPLPRLVRIKLGSVHSLYVHTYTRPNDECFAFVLAVNKNFLLLAIIIVSEKSIYVARQTISSLYSLSLFLSTHLRLLGRPLLSFALCLSLSRSPLYI